MQPHTLRSYNVLLTIPAARFTAFIIARVAEGLVSREATLQHVRQSTLEACVGDEARVTVLRSRNYKKCALIRPHRAKSRDRSGRRRIMQLISPFNKSYE
jgi:hypothetical protein